MKILSVGVALLLTAFLFGCRKQQPASATGPAETVTGFLRYYTIAADGPGLYYQKDVQAGKDSSDWDARTLLLSDGKGGYIVDGEGIESKYHQYIDKHSQLRFRDTGKKGCTSSSIAYFVCPGKIPVVDNLGFTIIP